MKNRRARCEVLQPRALHHQVLRVITELLILVEGRHQNGAAEVWRAHLVMLMEIVILLLRVTLHPS